jgi:hypothetical protein
MLCGGARGEYRRWPMRRGLGPKSGGPRGHLERPA